MIKWLQILLMFLSLLLMRPSLLGEKYSVVVIPVLLLTLFVKLFFRHKQEKESFNTSHLIILLVFMLLWVYLLVLSLLNNAHYFDYTIKAFILHTVVVAIFSFLLSEKEINKRFFRSVVYILAFFGIVCL